MLKNTLRAFCLLSLSSSALLAQNLTHEISCGHTPSPYRASVRHIEGKGIGYENGYTSLDLFIAPPSSLSRHWIPFFDTRVHIFNNGHIATNAGVGLRYVAPSFILGINTYYDYRETRHQKYNQYSLGLEALGKVFDFRLTGYLPVGATRSDFYHYQFAFFSGNSLFFSKMQEFAMKGLNAEMGIHIKTIKNASLYGAWGPYYFEKAGQNALGGKARLSGTFFNHLKLEVSGSYDPIFHGIAQAELSVIFPFGPQRTLKKQPHSSCQGRLRERAVQAVDRQEIIVIHHQEIVEGPLTNPLTHLPYRFLFVNNTGNSHGTIEDPYHSLAQAEEASAPGDIIYVFYGDGTSLGMDQGITLQHHQKLWGSGITHTLITSQGEVSIPLQTTGFPTLSNTNEAVVTLQDDCEVSGFHIFQTTEQPENHLSFIPIIQTSDITSDGPMTYSALHGVVHNNYLYNPAALFPIAISGHGNWVVAHNTLIGDRDGASIYFIHTSGNTFDALITNNNSNARDIVVHSTPTGPNSTTLNQNTMMIHPSF